MSLLPLAGVVIVGAADADREGVGCGGQFGPLAAAWVAVRVWLALASAVARVKTQALLTTVAVPTSTPSILTVTVSPVTPPPEITGRVVVSVLPLAGAAIVGGRRDCASR